MGRRTDAELIAAYRAGDNQASDELYRRHHDAALRLGTSLSDPVTAADLVSEAFTKILAALQDGRGPDSAFRTYLLTTVRNQYVDLVRSRRRESLVEDLGHDERLHPVAPDPSDAIIEGTAVERAFRSLPERWQEALWYTALRDEPLGQAAERMGLTRNALAQLSFRAREGLRTAYLAEQLGTADNPSCQGILEQIGRQARGKATAQERHAVRQHLAGCDACSDSAAVLHRIDTQVPAVILPALLGSVLADRAAPHLIGATSSLRTVGLAVGGAATAVVAALVLGIVLGARPDPLVVPSPTGPGTTSTAPPSSAAPSGSLSPSASPSASPSVSPSASPPGTPGAPVAAPSGEPAWGEPGPSAVVPSAERPSPTPPIVADARLTRIEAARLPTVDPWFHVEVGVASPPAPLVIRLRLTGVVGFVSHRADGFGPWSCRTGSGVGSVTCRLDTRTGPASSVLAFDVRVDGAATVDALVDLATGSDPDRTNDHVVTAIDPAPTGSQERTASGTVD